MSKTPPKTRSIKVRLTSLYYSIIKSEAHKRGISISSFIRNAIYEYIYRPSMVVRRDTPILRVDRTPKGSTKSEEKESFTKVIKELKTFDMTKLKKVPENEKRHIYNIMVKK